MICPRCQEENPEGRGFCIRCAYPLPEERQSEQVPAYEPINFDLPVNIQPDSPLRSTQSARRPIALGIVGFVMGILGLLMTFYGVMFLTSKDTVYELFTEYAGAMAEEYEAEWLAGIYGMMFGSAGVIFGLLAAIFGRKALRRLSAEPDRYAGRGMYLIALILGIVSLAACVVIFAAGVKMVK
ncbi:MAG: DUF4190 domain-containing protein [Clostridia bacterium]|nr:DUF4190 domain-containing protein [Clostridia bacterium]